jgi:hypothetical protein
MGRPASAGRSIEIGEGIVEASDVHTADPGIGQDLDIVGIQPDARLKVAKPRSYSRLT